MGNLWLQESFRLPRLKSNLKNFKSWSKIAEWENQTQYQTIFFWLANLYLNIFEWENLPDTCNERALELTLFMYGKALFFRDDVISDKGRTPIINSKSEGLYWHTPVNLGDKLNIYYESDSRMAYSYSFQKWFNMSNSVLIRSNRLMWPQHLTVIEYAQKLVDIQRAIDVVTRNMKVPFIVEVDEEQLTTAEEMFNKVWNNSPAILVNKNWKGIESKILNTGMTSGGQMLQDLWYSKKTTLAEIETRFGITSSNTEKKERLVVAEATSADQLTEDSIDFELKSRKEACELINQIFPSLPNGKIDVKLRNNVPRGTIQEGNNELYDDPTGLRSLEQR